MRRLTKLDSGWNFFSDFSSDLIRQPATGMPVRLPHNAVDLEMNYFDEGSFQKEFAYQRTLDWQPGGGEQEVTLLFDGAMADAVVWLNGVEVARHADGYTPFAARLTPHLRAGSNLLTVRVDGSENPDIPPFGGQIDYLTYAGLYRDVWLKVGDAVAIRDVKIETAHELSDAKTVSLRCRLDNPRALPCTGSLQCELRTLDGTTVASQTVSVDGEVASVCFSDLQGLALWHVDQPQLYLARLTLRTPYGEDQLDTRFGFRTAQFTAQGFLLNGEPLKIVGLNRHQSFPYVGYALGRRAQEKDADLLKHQLQCNLVRTSHYPQSPYFLDRCDEIGLLVFEEIPGWQHIGGERWKDEAVANVQRMIERDWNHPCIVMWGVRINESQDDHDFYTRTNQTAHALDSTRQTGGVRYIERSELLEDVYTMNDFFHVAAPDVLAGRAPAPLRDPDDVTGRPERVPYLVTEFNGHMYPTKRIDAEHRQAEHVTRYLQILDKAWSSPRYCGSIGWCMADYNTHKDFGAGDRVCHHGVLDMFREPKFAAYAYASQCEPSRQIILQPVTYWARGEKDRCEVLPLIVLTNCDYVELQFGDFVARQAAPDRVRYPHLPHPPVIIDERHVDSNEVNAWGMCWRDGKITGYIDGRAVAEVRLSGNPLPTTLQVQADDTTLLADEKDATRVIVRALDQVGRLLPFLDDVVTVEVSGPGRLLGPQQLPLKGGLTGFWVETIGLAGDIVISVRTRRLGAQRIVVAAC